MENLRILNSKERKDIAKKISDAFCIGFDFEYEVFMNNKNKIFILCKDVSRIMLEELRINSLGLYFGEINERGEIRLSIEASQIVGKMANQNVLELDDGHALKWLAGEDFEVDTELEGFVIVKNGTDFLGCGKVARKKLFNYVPKERRLAKLAL